jgi:hypothetical protein
MTDHEARDELERIVREVFSLIVLRYIDKKAMDILKEKM